VAFLIAADVLIQAERKQFDLEAWLRAHPQAEIKIAAITVAELWRSSEMVAGAQRERRQKFLERALGVFEVVPYSGQAAIEHARLWALLDATGQRSSMQDLILAATALVSGAAVVTFNTGRFAAMQGLTVVSP
jgi:predicted nucleic acid-binding protein